MHNEEQNGRVQLQYADRTQPVEVSAEITLPDYRSEISRLLWVRPVFLPPSRFVGGAKTDFSGPVCYRILYVGPDGALYGAESEGSYAFSLPKEGAEGFDLSEGTEAAVDVVPDAVISRVTGPRKISVRCRLHARVQAYANKNLTPRLRGEGAESDDLYRLCDATENGRMMASEVERVHLEDELVPEGSTADEMRLITAHGSVFLPDVTAAEDGVRCKGEALITLLCCREGGGEAQAPFTLQRRIPFEKLIPFAGIMPDWHAMAVGRIGHIDASVEEGSITLAVDVALSAQAQCEESVLLYRDVFLPAHRVECRTVNEQAWGCGFCGNRNFSVSGERPFAECGIAPDTEILDVVADAEIKEKQCEAGRTLLLGELRCHVLFRRAGEYETGEFSIPFRGMLEEQAEDMSLCCDVISCRVTSTAQGLRADAEIGLAVRSYCRRALHCLAEACFVPEEPVRHADIEICYPCAEDSLWSVGKRYGIAPDRLAAANGLPDDDLGAVTVLQDVKYLLVP